MIFTAAFWKAAAERAAKAFCYSLLITLGGGAVDVVEMPWLAAVKLAAGMAVLSLLGSAASGAATGGGPSLTNAEKIDA